MTELFIVKCVICFFSIIIRIAKHDRKLTQHSTGAAVKMNIAQRNILTTKNRFDTRNANRLKEKWSRMHKLIVAAGATLLFSIYNTNMNNFLTEII